MLLAPKCLQPPHYVLRNYIPDGKRDRKGRTDGVGMEENDTCIIKILLSSSVSSSQSAVSCSDIRGPKSVRTVMKIKPLTW